MAVTSLPIENDSSNSVTVVGSITTTLVNAINPQDATVPFGKGGLITLTNSIGSVTLHADKIAKDYDILVVIDNANNMYQDKTVSQNLGVNASIAYTKHKVLYISFTPVYFVTLSGSAPGIFSQVNGSKYVSTDPSNPGSSAATSHWFLYVFIIILFILIAILVGLFIIYKRKTKAMSGMQT
jgi:hypothetical protein